MRYLLDSNIIIYHLNNDEIATKFIHKNYSQSSISVISYYEIMAFKFEKDERARVEKFLSIFQVFEIDLVIVRNALNNLCKKKIKIADNLIASTAKVHNLTLVTRNTTDYSGIPIPILNIYQ